VELSFVHSHAFLQADCSGKRLAASQDLYLMEGIPQPAMLQAAAAVNFPPIWPYPKSFNNGSATVLVDPASFKFTATTPSPDLTAAFER
jgi:hypothetical protein